MPSSHRKETPSIAPEVGKVFESYDEAARAALLELRLLVLATAAETDGVGALTETLKWGQPAYLTSETGSGSTVRIAPTRSGSDYDYGMFFICSTDLVQRFRTLFGDTFTYDSNRALLFCSSEDRPDNELRECIAMALTYHVSP